MTATALVQLVRRAHLRAQAKQQRLTVEHILLALTECACLDDFWRKFNVDTEAVKVQLEAHLAKTARPIDSERPDGHVTPEFTQFMHRTLMHACLRGGTGEVRAGDVFAALFERDSYAAQVLKDCGLRLEDVLDYLDPYI